MSTSTPRAVILDRDGTIIVDHGYLGDPDGVTLLPGAAAGLRALHERGHALVIVSNQSGVGRGVLSAGQVREVNERLAAMVAEAGARIDGFYCCPHAPEDGCECRKPNTALVLQAAAELRFEPAQAIVIGDKSTDVGLGERLQALSMLVSADGVASDRLPCRPDYVVRDLDQAAQIIARLDATPAATARDTAV